MSHVIAKIEKGVERYQEYLERNSCFTLPCCYGTVLQVALAVLAVVGMTGVVPGMAVGCTAVGVGGIMGVLLVCGRCKQKALDYVIHGIAIAALLLIGSLGGAGVLSGVPLGGSILGIQGALVGLILLRPYFACKPRSRFHDTFSPLQLYNSRFLIPLPTRWIGID